MPKVEEIVRIRPRGAAPEYAHRYPDGCYQLRAPDLPLEGMNRAANATREPDLDRAAELIEKGYAIRMAPRAPTALKPVYIVLKNLKIIRR